MSVGSKRGITPEAQKRVFRASDDPLYISSPQTALGHKGKPVLGVGLGKSSFFITTLHNNNSAMKIAGVETAIFIWGRPLPYPLLKKAGQETRN